MKLDTVQYTDARKTTVSWIQNLKGQMLQSCRVKQCYITVQPDPFAKQGPTQYQGLLLGKSAQDFSFNLKIVAS